MFSVVSTCLALTDCPFQKQPADTQKKSERNVSKSPSGRLSSSLSPGRLAAARRLEAAAAKAHKEQTESNGGPNSNSRVVVPSSPPSPGISVGRDEKFKSSSKKFSLRELRNSSSNVQDSPENPASVNEVDKRTVEEVRLDHLSSMLASGQLQDSWGAGYSELNCHLSLVADLTCIKEPKTKVLCGNQVLRRTKPSQGRSCLNGILSRPNKVHSSVILIILISSSRSKYTIINFRCDFRTLPLGRQWPSC